MKKFFTKTKKIAIAVFSSVYLIAFVFFLVYNFSYKKNPHNNNSTFRNYHVMILGKYENELFLQQVYEGVLKYSDDYNSICELYVPHSKAEDESLNSMLEYASLLNVDGVITYISSEEQITPPVRSDGTIIPLITIGEYNLNIPQVSFIGNSYWELGKTFADESITFLQNEGTIFVINNSTSSLSSFSSLMNSFQSSLNSNENISYNVLSEIPSEEEIISILDTYQKPLFVCLTEEDSLNFGQIVSYLDRKDEVKLIGFGNNETVQLYYTKDIINILISENPEKIGEAAITELFEYRRKGYANSFATADLQIKRKIK